MKREEKNLQTRRKIIDSALQEFSEKTYSEASLNTICKLGNISKGIIYHYFKDKDELYLICIKECFDSLTSFLSKEVIADEKDIKKSLQKYFEARIAFFSKNPLYLNLFCSVVSNPPQHLAKEIAEIKSDFDKLNISVLTQLLESVKLRPGITIREVVDDFRLYQDYFNTQYQKKEKNKFTLKEHEERCHRSLNILLYGIVDQKE